MEERDIPEPEHEYLLDGDDIDDLEDELMVPDELCERDDSHGPATHDIGGHYLCDDCAEE